MHRVHPDGHGDIQPGPETDSKAHWDQIIPRLTVCWLKPCFSPGSETPRSKRYLESGPISSQYVILAKRQRQPLHETSDIERGRRPLVCHTADPFFNVRLEDSLHVISISPLPPSPHQCQSPWCDCKVPDVTLLKTDSRGILYHRILLYCRQIRQSRLGDNHHHVTVAEKGRPLIQGSSTILCGQIFRC